MTGKKKIPEIRFKGFGEDWEEKKLGEIAETYSGGTPSVGYKEYYDGKIPFIRSGEINTQSTELFITEKGLQNSSAKLVKEGDILYALYGATSGEVGISHINGAINQAILAIKPKYGYNSYLIAQWLRKEKEAIVGTYLQGGQGNLSGSIVKELDIIIPSDPDEQTKIGTYFKTLDHLITLNQRKYDKLVNVKKSMLEKMFPKNGADVPEIRFKGFGGAWEERKVGDQIEVIGTGRSCFVSNTGKSENAPFAILGSTSIIGYDSEFNYSGDFILTARVGANAGDLYRYSGKVKISDNTVFIQGKNLDFLFFLLTNFNLKKLAFGTGQPLVKASELNNLKLMFSVNEKEQTKIGTFFKQLDHLITLHKQELDKLKNIKKACLEKMFV